MLTTASFSHYGRAYTLIMQRPTRPLNPWSPTKALTMGHKWDLMVHISLGCNLPHRNDFYFRDSQEVLIMAPLVPSRWGLLQEASWAEIIKAYRVKKMAPEKSEPWVDYLKTSFLSDHNKEYRLISSMGFIGNSLKWPVILNFPRWS